jgi:simple sugar transport system permease protein
VWAIVRKNRTDAILAGVLSSLALLWYSLAETLPDWWAAILPYVIVLVVLIFFTKRLRPPAAAGRPYRKGGG